MRILYPYYLMLSCLLPLVVSSLESQAQTGVRTTRQAEALRVTADMVSEANKAVTLRAEANAGALVFDGSYNEVRVVQADLETPALLADVTNTFTIEAWVNPTAPHELDQESSTSTDGTYGQRYLIFPTGGWEFGTDDHAGAGISIGTNGVSVYEHAGSYMPPVLVWQGAITGWTHVAVVYQDRQPLLYVNGTLVKKGVVGTHTLIHPSLGFGGGSYGHYQGGLDELRIWRGARTAAQIEQHKDRTVASTTAGLCSYWRCDEGLGMLLYDAVSALRTGVAGDLTKPTWQTPSTAPLRQPAYTWRSPYSSTRSSGSQLTVTPTQTTTYTVSATAGASDSTTAAVTVTVFCPPVELQVPAAMTVVAGNPVTLYARCKALEFGNSLLFGLADRIAVTEVDGSTPALLSELTNTFTVEAWVKPMATHEIHQQATTGTAGIFGQRYLLYPTGGWSWGEGHAGMGISVGTNGVSVFEHAGSYMPPLLVWQGALTEWTHVAVVYEDRRPSLYINGELVAQGERSKKASVHPSLGIGGGDNYGRYQGSLDEVRIWRTARTPAQLQVSMRQPITVTEPGLVSYWPLDEGQGTVARDMLSAQRIGSFQGTPSWQPSSTTPMGKLSYVWSPATGLAYPEGTEVTAHPTQTTTYTVTATGPSGCRYGQAQVRVTVTGTGSAEPVADAANDQLHVASSFSAAAGRGYVLTSKGRVRAYEVDGDGVARTGTYQHADGTRFELRQQQVLVDRVHAVHHVTLLP